MVSAHSSIPQLANKILDNGCVQTQGFLLCPGHSPQSAQQRWPAGVYLLHFVHHNPFPKPSVIRTTPIQVSVLNTKITPHTETRYRCISPVPSAWWLYPLSFS